MEVGSNAAQSPDVAMSQPLGSCWPVPTMKTPILSIVLFAVAAALGAVGQFLYKSGAAQISSSWWSLFNVRLLGGMVCYVSVMALFVAAFKKGGELSVLYPVYASTFIWAALISLAAYGTPLKPVNFAGMMLLVAGMFLMGQ
jgi:multidrug transporter EmrE-like cation transporter